MFKGTYRHRLDAKGRLPIPAAFRRALSERAETSVVLTRLDQCLAGYAPTEWARLEAQIREQPSFRAPVKALTRLLFSQAADCELDVQGRILVPTPRRAAAGLQQDVLVVGVLDRFEIWDPATWDAFLRDSERLLDDVAFEVAVPLPAPPAKS